MQAGLKAYQKTSITTADKLRLILLMYEACIRHLFKLKEAIEKKNLKKKGEHLSKSIEIINELINSLKDDKNDEVVQFLTGLYVSIIQALGKVNIENDINTVVMAIKYIAQLRSIWKEHVMKANVHSKEGLKGVSNSYKSGEKRILRGGGVNTPTYSNIQSVYGGY